MPEKHLEWSVDGVLIRDGEDEPVAMTNGHNGNLIVSAVNAYVPMRAALIELLDVLDNGVDEYWRKIEAQDILRRFPHISKIGE